MAHRPLERDVDPSQRGHKYSAFAFLACFPCFFEVRWIQKSCLILTGIALPQLVFGITLERECRKDFAAALEALRIENEDQRYDDDVQDDKKKPNPFRDGQSGGLERYAAAIWVHERVANQLCSVKP